MIALPIENATRRLGAPKQWDHAEEGICHTLEIVDRDGWMISAWKPSPAEIMRLAAGAPMFLHIQGASHPVVALVVGEKPSTVKET